jgi:hypothetical protein
LQLQTASEMNLAERDVCCKSDWTNIPLLAGICSQDAGHPGVNENDAVTEATSGYLPQRLTRRSVAELGGEPYIPWLRSLRPRNRV